MLNIVIPMAGAGSRFKVAGYIEPKPLIKIKGIPMIQIVINNLTPDIEHRFIFICQEKHILEYDLNEKLSKWSPNCKIIGIDGITEGAACTVLFAREFIDNNDALMIANSDQYIDVDINKYLEIIDDNKSDGLIMTMKANDSKWSYIGFDKNNKIDRVVEKEVISDEATVGIYNFKHGKDFVSAANHMILNNQRVNNEFYVAPTYNRLIELNKKIAYFNIGKESDGMYGLGIPEDLIFFNNHNISNKAIEKVNENNIT
jgi:dTDP-glucose pyrophosphorylase